MKKYTAGQMGAIRSLANIQMKEHTETVFIIDRYAYCVI